MCCFAQVCPCNKMYVIVLPPNMPIVSVNMMIHHDSPNADSSLDLQINLCLLMFQPTEDVSNTNLHWNLLDHIIIDQLLCLYNWGFPKSWGGTPHFHRIFHHKTNHFGGSPIFRKPRRWTPVGPTPDCGHVCRGQPRCRAWLVSGTMTYWC